MYSPHSSSSKSQEEKKLTPKTGDANINSPTTSLQFESPSSSSGSSNEDDDSLTRDSTPNDTTEDTTNNKATPPSFTTAATAAAAATALSLLYWRERQHQKRLCQAWPQVYTSSLKDNNDTTNVFTIRRPMRPFLWVGTRGIVSSTVSFLHPGPPSCPPVTATTVWKIPLDGGTVALHWYAPVDCPDAPWQEWGDRSSETTTKATTPVILLLHGLNNHAGFGYMRHLAKACVEQGWIAVALDFRGTTAKVTTTTPRLYTAAYTTDLRAVLQRLSHLCTTLAAVGNSLGANLLVKYLGENSQSSSCCLRAAVTLSNPVAVDSRHAPALYSPLLAAGLKRSMLRVQSQLQPMLQQSASFGAAWRHCLYTAWTLPQVDRALVAHFPRNAPDGGCGPVGYADGSEEYWKESSSYRYMSDIEQTPWLHVVAANDGLIGRSFWRHLHVALANPRCTVVVTPCGGHLGWQEEQGGMYAADVLVVDYLKRYVGNGKERSGGGGTSSTSLHNRTAVRSKL